jgi:hypothetical protein
VVGGEGRDHNGGVEQIAQSMIPKSIVLDLIGDEDWFSEKIMLH